MNDLIRSIIIKKIQQALSESELATQLKHPGLNGRLKEILVNELIMPLLNNQYSIGTGKVIDYRGGLSKQIDICIYGTRLHPPLFFSQDEKFGIVPIESVLKCIEVKSVLNKSSLRQAYNNFKYLEENLIMTSGYHDEYEMPLPHLYVKHKYEVFSFDAGSKYSPDLILNMYKTIDSNWDTNPLIQSICISNKGWLCHTIKGWIHKKYDEINNINEEIIGYLCTLIQDLPKVETSRGVPRIGYYLTDPSISDRFRNGRRVKKPWKKRKQLIFENTLIKK
jgi:hypothetical protein